MKDNKLSFTNKTLPIWLETDKANSLTVLSSRVRFARNLAGYPFPTKATANELDEILEMISTAIKKEETLYKFFPDCDPIAIDKITPLQAEFLVERHLISPDFLHRMTKKKDFKSSGSFGRAAFINQDETVSLMVNEEDHLRFQVLSAGLNFTDSFQKLDELDDCLESLLQYAYSQQYGFLTACPSNVGTGLRASVMIHLPGLVLTKEIDKVLRAIWQIGYAVRGLYGEGTETRGYFFQISNTVCLGQSEAEIIEGIEKVTNQLISHEEKAREYLSKNMKSEIEDKVYRALALLNSARLITSEEALNLLATVRLGVAMKIITNITLTALNKIMFLLKPANLQVFYNQEMSPHERDEKRAALIRQILTETPELPINL
jgi:protein arginine kinase